MLLRWGWRIHLAIYRLERRLYWKLARLQGQTMQETNTKKPTLKERLKDVVVGASLLGIFIIPIAVTIICVMFGG